MKIFIAALSLVFLSITVILAGVLAATMSRSRKIEEIFGTPKE